MNDAFHMAASGMSAISRLLEASARNAANARTPGYLSRLVSNRTFETELDRMLGRDGSLLTSIEHVSFKQGTVVPSSDPLHVALDGPGFLTVQGPDGLHYTRNGALALSADGTLSTHGGYALIGETGPIRADLNAGADVRIAQDGRVYQGSLEIGKLRVTEFGRRGMLMRTADTLFSAPEAAEARAATETELVPEHLELPAEKSIVAMVNMIEASKSFEAQQRVIRTIGQSYEQLIRP